jgi:hypothetical protein
MSEFNVDIADFNFINVVHLVLLVVDIIATVNFIVVGSDHANFIFILKDPNHTTFEISLGA